jgi:hypothetical protein
MSLENLINLRDSLNVLINVKQEFETMKKELNDLKNIKQEFEVFKKETAEELKDLNYSVDNLTAKHRNLQILLRIAKNDNVDECEKEYDKNGYLIHVKTNQKDYCITYSKFRYYCSINNDEIKFRFD